MIRDLPHFSDPKLDTQRHEMLFGIVRFSIYFNAHQRIYERIEGAHAFDGSAKIMIHTIVDIAELLCILTCPSI